MSNELSDFDRIKNMQNSVCNYLLTLDNITAFSKKEVYEIVKSYDLFVLPIWGGAFGAGLGTGESLENFFASGDVKVGYKSNGVSKGPVLPVTFKGGFNHANKYGLRIWPLKTTATLFNEKQIAEYELPGDIKIEASIVSGFDFSLKNQDLVNLDSLKSGFVKIELEPVKEYEGVLKGVEKLKKLKKYANAIKKLEVEVAAEGYVGFEVKTREAYFKDVEKIFNSSVLDDSLSLENFKDKLSTAIDKGIEAGFLVDPNDFLLIWAFQELGHDKNLLDQKISFASDYDIELFVDQTANKVYLRQSEEGSFFNSNNLRDERVVFNEFGVALDSATINYSKLVEQAQYTGIMLRDDPAGTTNSYSGIFTDLEWRSFSNKVNADLLATAKVAPFANDYLQEVVEEDLAIFEAVKKESNDSFFSSLINDDQSAITHSTLVNDDGSITHNIYEYQPFIDGKREVTFSQFSGIAGENSTHVIMRSIEDADGFTTDIIEYKELRYVDGNLVEKRVLGLNDAGELVEFDTDTEISNSNITQFATFINGEARFEFGFDATVALETRDEITYNYVFEKDGVETLNKVVIRKDDGQGVDVFDVTLEALTLSHPNPEIIDRVDTYHFVARNNEMGDPDSLDVRSHVYEQNGERYDVPVADLEFASDIFLFASQDVFLSSLIELPSEQEISYYDRLRSVRQLITALGHDFTYNDAMHLIKVSGALGSGVDALLTNINQYLTDIEDTDDVNALTLQVLDFNKKNGIAGMGLIDLSKLSVDELVSLAWDQSPMGRSVRYALDNVLPFATFIVEGTAANSDQYDFDNYSLGYIDDRVRFVKTYFDGLLDGKANLNNDTGELSVKSNNIDELGLDVFDSKFKLQVDSKSKSGDIEKIIFGDAEDNTLQDTDGNKKFTAFGGVGDDTLVSGTARSSSSSLEGGIGSDTYNIGSEDYSEVTAIDDDGDDTYNITGEAEAKIFDTDGADTYNFNQYDGKTEIYDKGSNGDDKIYIDGVDIREAFYLVSDKESIWQDKSRTVTIEKVGDDYYVKGLGKGFVKIDKHSAGMLTLNQDFHDQTDFTSILKQQTLLSTIKGDNREVVIDSIGVPTIANGYDLRDEDVLVQVLIGLGYSSDTIGIDNFLALKEEVQTEISKGFKAREVGTLRENLNTIVASYHALLGDQEIAQGSFSFVADDAAYQLTTNTLLSRYKDLMKDKIATFVGGGDLEAEDLLAELSLNQYTALLSYFIEGSGVNFDEEFVGYIQSSDWPSLYMEIAFGTLHSHPDDSSAPDIALVSKQVAHAKEARSLIKDLSSEELQSVHEHLVGQKTNIDDFIAGLYTTIDIELRQTTNIERRAVYNQLKKDVNFIRERLQGENLEITPTNFILPEDAAKKADVTYSRDTGGFNFSPEQITELDGIRAELNAALDDPSRASEVGLGYKGYLAVLKMISNTRLVDGQNRRLAYLPKQGVDSIVHTWLLGAIDVNRGIGFSAEFIREYTRIQYEQRGYKKLKEENGITGVLDAQAANQRASNEIALGMLEDIVNNGNLPGIEGIGAIDGGAGASTAFEYQGVEDYAPWAGSLLFPYLGVSKFFTDLILKHQVVEAAIPNTEGEIEVNKIKFAEGTYDFLAMLRAAEVATTAAATASDLSFSQAFRNLINGPDVPVKDVGDLVEKAKEFFLSYYDLTESDGFAPWLDLILRSEKFIDRLSLTNYEHEYFLGTYGDDDIRYNSLSTAIERASLLDVKDPAMMHGGLGDDYLEGGEFADLIDGGEGNDELAGLEGDDFLYGGKGKDTLHSTSGNNTLKGGAGDDVYIVDGTEGDTVVISDNGSIKLADDDQSESSQDIYNISGSGRIIITDEGDADTYNIGSRENDFTGSLLIDDWSGEESDDAYFITGNATDIEINDFYGSNQYILEDFGGELTIGGRLDGDDWLIIDGEVINGAAIPNEGVINSWRTRSGKINITRNSPVNITTESNGSIKIEEFDEGDLGIYLEGATQDIIDGDKAANGSANEVNLESISEDIYVVLSGDSISSIMRRMGASYFDEDQRELFLNDNKLSAESTLWVGQKLINTFVEGYVSPSPVPVAKLDEANELSLNNQKAEFFLNENKIKGSRLDDESFIFGSGDYKIRAERFDIESIDKKYTEVDINAGLGRNFKFEESYFSSDDKTTDIELNYKDEKFKFDEKLYTNGEEARDIELRVDDKLLKVDEDYYIGGDKTRNIRIENNDDFFTYNESLYKDDNGGPDKEGRFFHLSLDGNELKASQKVHSLNDGVDTSNGEDISNDYYLRVGSNSFDWQEKKYTDGQSAYTVNLNIDNDNSITVDQNRYNTGEILSNVDVRVGENHLTVSSELNATGDKITDASVKVGDNQLEIDQRFENDEIAQNTFLKIDEHSYSHIESFEGSQKLDSYKLQSGDDYISLQEVLHDVDRDDRVTSDIDININGYQFKQTHELNNDGDTQDLHLQAKDDFITIDQQLDSSKRKITDTTISIDDKSLHLDQSYKSLGSTDKRFTDVSMDLGIGSLEYRTDIESDQEAKFLRLDRGQDFLEYDENVLDNGDKVRNVSAQYQDNSFIYKKSQGEGDELNRFVELKIDEAKISSLKENNSDGTLRNFSVGDGDDYFSLSSTEFNSGALDKTLDLKLDDIAFSIDRKTSLLNQTTFDVSLSDDRRSFNYDESLIGDVDKLRDIRYVSVDTSFNLDQEFDGQNNIHEIIDFRRGGDFFTYNDLYSGEETSGTDFSLKIDDLSFSRQYETDLDQSETKTISAGGEQFTVSHAETILQDGRTLNAFDIESIDLQLGIKQFLSGDNEIRTNASSSISGIALTSTYDEVLGQSTSVTADNGNGITFVKQGDTTQISIAIGEGSIVVEDFDDGTFDASLSVAGFDITYDQMLNANFSTSWIVRISRDDEFVELNSEGTFSNNFLVSDDVINTSPESVVLTLPNELGIITVNSDGTFSVELENGDDTLSLDQAGILNALILEGDASFGFTRDTQAIGVVRYEDQSITLDKNGVKSFELNETNGTFDYDRDGALDVQLSDDIGYVNYNSQNGFDFDLSDGFSSIQYDAGNFDVVLSDGLSQLTFDSEKNVSASITDGNSSFIYGEDGAFALAAEYLENTLYFNSEGDYLVDLQTYSALYNAYKQGDDEDFIAELTDEDSRLGIDGEGDLYADLIDGDNRITYLSEDEYSVSLSDGDSSINLDQDGISKVQLDAGSIDLGYEDVDGVDTFSVANDNLTLTVQKEDEDTSLKLEDDNANTITIANGDGDASFGLTHDDKYFTYDNEDGNDNYKIGTTGDNARILGITTGDDIKAVTFEQFETVDGSDVKKNGLNITKNSDELNASVLVDDVAFGFNRTKIVGEEVDESFTQTQVSITQDQNTEDQRGITATFGAEKDIYGLVYKGNTLDVTNGEGTTADFSYDDYTLSLDTKESRIKIEKDEGDEKKSALVIEKGEHGLDGEITYDGKSLALENTNEGFIAGLSDGDNKSLSWEKRDGRSDVVQAIYEDQTFTVSGNENKNGWNAVYNKGGDLEARISSDGSTIEPSLSYKGFTIDGDPLSLSKLGFKFGNTIGLLLGDPRAAFDELQSAISDAFGKALGDESFDFNFGSIYDVADSVLDTIATNRRAIAKEIGEEIAGQLGIDGEAGKAAEIVAAAFFEEVFSYFDDEDGSIDFDVVLDKIKEVYDDLRDDLIGDVIQEASDKVGKEFVDRFKITDPASKRVFENFVSGITNKVLSDQLSWDDLRAELGNFPDTLFDEWMKEELGDEIALALSEFGVTFSGIITGEVFKKLQTTYEEVKQALSEIAAGRIDVPWKTVISMALTDDLADALGVSENVAGALIEVGFEAVAQIVNAVRDGATLAEGFSSVELKQASVNIVAAYIGTELGKEIYEVKTQEGALGGAIGATAGAELGAEIGANWGPIGIVIGAAVGYVVGAVIGDLIAGTPKESADIVFNYETNKFETANYWIKNGGIDGTSVYMLSDNAADILNEIVTAIDGDVLNSGIDIRTNIYIKHDKLHFTDINNESIRVSSLKDLMGYSVISGLDALNIGGGNVYLKRAIYRKVDELTSSGEVYPEDILESLLGYVTIADDYQNYLNNAESINELIATKPDSTFTMSWIATLEQAQALGLTRRYASDHYGGWSYLVEKEAVVVDGTFRPRDVRASYAEMELKFDQNEGRIITVNRADQSQAVTGDYVEHSSKRVVQFISDTEFNDERNLRLAELDEEINQLASALYDQRLAEEEYKANNSNDALDEVTDEDKAQIQSDALRDARNQLVPEWYIFDRDIAEVEPGRIPKDRVIRIIQNSDASVGFDSGASLGIRGAEEEIFSSAVIHGADNLDDVFHAGDLGNDVFGYGGNDIISGGRNADWIYGGSGDDVLYVGGGNNNALFGEENEDELYGGEGSDWLDGGVNDDHIEGGDGDDIIIGGEGIDTLLGQGGNDVYVFNKGDGHSIITDEDGVVATFEDRFNGEVQTVDVTVDLLEQAAEGVRNGTSFEENSPLDRVARSLVNGTSVYKDFVRGANIVGGYDIIEFGNGIELKHVNIHWDKPDQDGGTDQLIITLLNSPGDQIIINNWSKNFSRVEVLRFADGQELELGNFTSFIIGNDEDNVLLGDGGANFIHGGDGDDSIFALAGSDTAIGGLGNDLVTGGADSDLIVGAENNDDLFGDSGNDIISGDQGNDYVAGGADNDILSGGKGNDTINTGSGDDTVIFGRGDGSDVLVDSQGDDKQDVATVKEDGTIEFRGGFNFFGDYDKEGIWDRENDRLRDGLVWEKDGDEWKVNKLIFDKQNNIEKTIDSGEDTLEFKVGISLRDIRVKTEGNDLKVGVEQVGVNAEKFDNIEDNITIKEFFGSAENSIETFRFFGVEDIDTSTIKNWVGGDEEDNDISIGAQLGRSWITTGQGKDTIIANEANDIINAGDDDDVIFAGAGADIVFGGQGIDTLDYSTADQSAETIKLSQNISQTDTAIDIDGVEVILDREIGSLGEAKGDRIYGVENIVGSIYNDRLIGDSKDNEFYANEGYDYVVGGLGDDTYHFDAGKGPLIVSEYDFEYRIQGGGTDTIEFGEGINVGDIGFDYAFTQDEGTDLIIKIFDKPNDFIRIKDYLSVRGDFGIVEQLSFVNGGLFDLRNMAFENGAIQQGNWTVGNNDDNVLDSGAGDDILSGRGGVDILRGREGDDIFVGGLGSNIEGDDTGDQLNGGSGSDTAAYFDSDEAVTVYLDNGAANVGGTALGDLYNSIENLVGSAFDDKLHGTYGANKIEGGKGEDIIYGRSGGDSLHGGEAKDYLYGESGDDSLYGQEGDDELYGGIGNDKLWGDLGTDKLYGGQGDDELRDDGGDNNELYGGEGNDLLVGGLGIDKLFGGAGEDSLRGGDSDDELKGGAGDDALFGESGHDKLDGGEGDDYIVGGAGHDTIIGVTGDDTLIGGLGEDVLKGKSGNDVLFGGRDNDHLFGGAGTDFLIGGRGDDYLEGGQGSDFYIFEDDFGTDTVHDRPELNNPENRQVDEIVFSGIGFERLWMEREGDDLVISVIGRNDNVTIKDFSRFRINSDFRGDLIALLNNAVDNLKTIETVRLDTHQLTVDDVEEITDLLEGQERPDDIDGLGSLVDGNGESILDQISDKWEIAEVNALDAKQQFAPNLQDRTIEVDFEQAVTGEIKGSDRNPDDQDALSYSISPDGNPANGVFTIDSDGKYSFTPNAGFAGQTKARVQVTDPTGLSDFADLTFNVLPDPELPDDSSGGGSESNNAPNPIIFTPINDFKIDEGVEIGTVVATVDATDPDGTSPVLSLINEDTDETPFKLVGNQLITTKSFELNNDEPERPYNLNFLSTDSEDANLKTSGKLEIIIEAQDRITLDFKDIVKNNNGDLSILENEQGITVATVLVNGLVENNFFTLDFDETQNKGLFKLEDVLVNGVTEKQIQLTRSPNFEADGVNNGGSDPIIDNLFDLAISATRISTGEEISLNQTIALTDVDDLPKEEDILWTNSTNDGFVGVVTVNEDAGLDEVIGSIYKSIEENDPDFINLFEDSGSGLVNLFDDDNPNPFRDWEFSFAEEDDGAGGTVKQDLDGHFKFSEDASSPENRGEIVVAKNLSAFVGQTKQIKVKITSPVDSNISVEKELSIKIEGNNSAPVVKADVNIDRLGTDSDGNGTIDDYEQKIYEFDTFKFNGDQGTNNNEFVLFSLEQLNSLFEDPDGDELSFRIENVSIAGERLEDGETETNALNGSDNSLFSTFDIDTIQLDKDGDGIKESEELALVVSKADELDFDSGRRIFTLGISASDDFLSSVQGNTGVQYVKVGINDVDEVEFIQLNIDGLVNTNRSGPDPDIVNMHGEGRYIFTYDYTGDANSNTWELNSITFDDFSDSTDPLQGVIFTDLGVTPYDVGHAGYVLNNRTIKNSELDDQPPWYISQVFSRLEKDWDYFYYDKSPTSIVLPPVIIDLDKDGFTWSKTRFTYESGGNPISTAWVGSGEGILALDRNNNTIIDSGDEISFVNDLSGAASDLEGLAAFDSNNNGLLDGDDERYEDFKVWQDKNQNGISEKSELKSLSQLGIVSIDLALNGSSIDSNNVNVNLLNTSTANFADGTSSVVGDVVFSALSDDSTFEPEILGTDSNDFIIADDTDDKVDGAAGNDEIYGGAGNDQLRGDDGLDEIHGEAGDDDIRGGKKIDKLFGGDGNDDIQGNSGADLIVGGAGQDYLNGGFGNDDILGGEGDDVIYGKHGDDTIDGGSGADFIDGGDGIDTISGGSGDDILLGGAEDDGLIGGEGDDILIGETGNDTIVDALGSNTLVFTRGDGADTVNINTEGESGTFDLRLLGITSSEFAVVIDGSDIVFDLGMGDQIRFAFTYTNLAFDDARIESTPLNSIRFFDSEGAAGVVWDRSQVVDEIYQALHPIVDLSVNGAAPTEEADLIQGTNSADTIDGLGGDDQIYGNGGQDSIAGSSGNDHIYGGDEADILRGSQLSAEISTGVIEQGLNEAGEIEEKIVYLDDDSIYGEAGNDFIVGNEGTDQLYGGDGNDIIYGDTYFGEIYTNAEIDNDPSLILRPDNAKAGEFADIIQGGDGDDLIFGGFDDDIIEGEEGEDTVVGGHGNDYISGGVDNDDLSGSEGNDSIEGGEGLDVLFGNEGNDILDGGIGNDTLIGDVGEDVLIGDEGDDILSAGDDNDFLFGDEGDDELIGGSGDDTLSGGTGDDLFVGGIGDDLIEGGEGQNTLRFTLGDSIDTVTAGDATTDRYVIDLKDIKPADFYVTHETLNADTPDESDDIVLIVLNFSDTDKIVFEGLNLDDENFSPIDEMRFEFVDETGQAQQLILGPDEVKDRILNPVRHGTEGDDILLGTNGKDVIFGHGGNDQIYGFGGEDILDGGDGNDALIGGEDADQMTGGAGDDTYEVDHQGDVVVEAENEGNDTVVASLDYILGANVENLVLEGSAVTAQGNELANYLGGNFGDNVLNGADGDDVLNGSKGNDILDGGSGNDLIQFARGDGQDTIKGAPGYYLLALTDISENDVNISVSGSNLIFDLGEGDVLTIEGFDELNSENTLKIAQVTFINGSNEVTWDWQKISDQIETSLATIVGQDDVIPNFDNLNGTGGNDRIAALAGDDRIWAQSGDDVVAGGTGLDWIDGGEGHDVLMGGAGVDSLYGRNGDDTLDGGTENDIIRGGHGDDRYIFEIGDGNDVIDEEVGGIDRLVFGEGITREDLGIGVSGNDLIVSYSDHDDVHILQNFSDQFRRLEWVELSTGELISMSELVAENPIERTGTSHNDHMHGDNVYADKMYAKQGSDTLYGNGGNDQLFGQGGADHLYGGDDDDMLKGGNGNDTLDGGNGNDEYVFNAGHGQDLIRNYDTSGIDTLSFGSSVSLDDLVFERQNNNLKISIDGTSDSVTVEVWYQEEARKLDFVEIGEHKFSTDAVEQLVQALASVGSGGAVSIGVGRAEDENIAQIIAASTQ